ncbi:thiol-disulfide oxidoreductase DCC family protein [Paenibacillus septentrionalis]|uniref:Thiol-disulfide oxidoreductase DCC family protein n=1 Tax=Paenibacillus septentrionalis TaxID=429342 RepID=A0ABW1V020_9BACL
MKPQTILLYDGECSFCNRTVQWIIVRDPRANIKFASQQGELGMQLRAHYKIPDDVDSLVFIDQNKAYVYSEAALRVTKHLHRAWPFMQLLLVIPVSIRNAAYRYFAKHRYQWFGKQHACLIPTPEIRARYLD